MNQLTEKLIAFVFNHLVSQQFLSGYRMKLGGATFILGGVVLFLNMVIAGAWDDTTAEKAVGAIGLGYTIIGGAGKFDKAAEAKLIAVEQAGGV